MTEKEMKMGLYLLLALSLLGRRETDKQVLSTVEFIFLFDVIVREKACE